MATGVLSQNEQLYFSVNNNVPTTSMEGSSRRPTPKYTKVGERLRHVIPGHVACSMACGGRACKYENPARWSEQEQAIKGIYSSWVTDNILAMARPSTELIEKYNIIEQFQSYGIKTVINLQRPGEHASCGNTLEPESGFTYLPEAFMEAGIYFYNFGWKDYGVASLTTILDMVKVMTFALQEGKVAIHCHAGLGRTGVLIACYLVFATRMTADQAIIFVRAKRPNSIQTRGQLLCIREFTQFLIPLRNVFSCCEPKAHAVTLSQYLIRQRHLLHGYEARLLKHVPKIIHLVCKLLLDLAENRQVIKEDILKIPDLSTEIEKTVSEMVTMQLDKELMRRVNDVSLPFTPSSVAVAFENQDAVFSSEHEFDPLWKRRNVECLQPLTHLKRRLSYSDSDLKRAEFLLEQGETPWTVPTQVVLCCDLKQQQQQQPPPQPVSQACVQSSPPLDFNKEALVRNTFTFWNQPKCGGLEGSRDEGSPLFLRRKIPKEIQRSRTFSSGFSGVHNTGESVPAKVANVPGPPSSLPQKADHCRNDPGSNWGQDPMACGGNYCVPQNCDAAPGAECFVRSENQESNAPPQAMPLSVEARRVLAAKALANLNEFIEEAEIKQKVEMWQKELNSRDGAWERICGERDPFILCGLMWSWVEQLKEPVITKEDVDLLVNNCADASEALSLLEKGQHQTILCILHCIVNLQTIPADVEEAFLAHAIKSFTKVIYLRGRGTNGLQRNILAENILEKFKDELETIHAKEQNQLAQMCEKHGEIMNLMCLNDDEPICGICKLFGDHKPHRIAKISEAYSARKITFAEDIQLVLQKSESTTQATEETEKLISELITSTADTRAMIDTIGSSLLNGIKFRIATLKKKLDNEHSTKLEKLQLVARELQAPRQLYQQMKTLLEQHLNAVQFLHEDKKLRTEMERLMEGNSLPKVPIKDNISIRHYFQELIKGMNITDFVLCKTDQVLVNTAELCEAWRSGCPTQSTLSGDIPDETFCKTVLGLFRKPNEKELSLPRNPSCSACSPSTPISSSQESDAGSKESIV